MTKYNPSFKQQVIDFYLAHHQNLALTPRQFGLKSKTLRRWIAQFHYSGSKGLAVLHTKRAYSPAFKLQVVRAVLSGEFTLLEKSWTKSSEGTKPNSGSCRGVAKNLPVSDIIADSQFGSEFVLLPQQAEDR